MYSYLELGLGSPAKAATSTLRVNTGVFVLVVPLRFELRAAKVGAYPLMQNGTCCKLGGPCFSGWRLQRMGYKEKLQRQRTQKRVANMAFAMQCDQS